MTTIRRHARRIALVGVALGAACATRPPRLATDPPTLLIRIENRGDTSTPISVWAVPAHGQRLRLGMLTSATTNLVRFDRVEPTTEYRLLAERTGGATISSQPFIPGRAGVVAWDLAANTITPVEAAQP